MTKFIMMVGLPGSGKSLRAKNLAVKENAIIHSSDTLRQELFGDENTQDNNEELFTELHRRIKQDLKGEQNVIYDATNISYKRRKAFLEELKKINCEKICYLVATPYEKCLDQNKSRKRQIPEYVIKKMYLSFYIPQYYEGWDKINIIWNDEEYNFDIHELFNGANGLNKISQDNPNHTLTIGEHCLKCAGICEELVDDFELNMAALYHDIGKRFTKQFKNSKGEDTDIAHYYQHHLVSAYDSMFYLRWLDDYTMLNVVKYIQWHMQPFFIKTDKAKNKLINLIGQTAYEKLLILHKADKLAK
jgi:predicted kinase/predicted HD phosphohydrolase